MVIGAELGNREISESLVNGQLILMVGRTVLTRDPEHHDAQHIYVCAVASPCLNKTITRETF